MWNENDEFFNDVLQNLLFRHQLNHFHSSSYDLWHWDVHNLFHDSFRDSLLIPSRGHPTQCGQHLVLEFLNRGAQYFTPERFPSETSVGVSGASFSTSAISVFITNFAMSLLNSSDELEMAPVSTDIGQWSAAVLPARGTSGSLSMALNLTVKSRSRSEARFLCAGGYSANFLLMLTSKVYA